MSAKETYDFGAYLEDLPGMLRPADLAMIADTVTGLEETYRERMLSVKLVGSRARGTAKPTSDFDFLVFLDICDYAIEVPKLADLALRLEKAHRHGPVSISPMTSEQFLGLDTKYEGITDNFRRDALRLWPEGRGR